LKIAILISLAAASLEYGVMIVSFKANALSPE
jgi:hypothetical protein